MTGIMNALYGFSSTLVVIVGYGLCTCPVGFENHGLKCYRAVDVKASWIEAKMYCRLFGSNLAIIEDQAEESLIEGMLTRLHGVAHVEDYWVDGTDILGEREWRWMRKDGQSTLISGYTHWSPGQPDNGANQEHCLLIRYSYGLKWNDYHCDGLCNFVCESSHSEAAILG